VTESNPFGADSKLNNKIGKIKEIIKSIKHESSLHQERPESALGIDCNSNVFDISEMENSKQIQTPDGFNSISFAIDKTKNNSFNVFEKGKYIYV
jgi:hypothetical protein